MALVKRHALYERVQRGRERQVTTRFEQQTGEEPEIRCQQDAKTRP